MHLSPATCVFFYGVVYTADDCCGLQVCKATDGTDSSILLCCLPKFLSLIWSTICGLYWPA